MLVSFLPIFILLSLFKNSFCLFSTSLNLIRLFFIALKYSKLKYYSQHCHIIHSLIFFLLLINSLNIVVDFGWLLDLSSIGLFCSFGFKLSKASTCFLPWSSIVFICFSKAFSKGESANVAYSIICCWLDGNISSLVRYS